MKRIISLIAVMSIVFMSVLSCNATYKLYEDIPYSENTLYFDRVKEYNAPFDEEINYREYCHYSDENSDEPEWVLRICSILPEPWEYRHGALVGNRALYNCSGPGLAKSETGLMVYIPKTDTFIDLVNANVDTIIELCPDFVEVIEENKLGREMGDVNDDDRVDILDATYIQCALSDMPAYSLWAIYSVPKIFSVADYDLDGESTIMDATSIQKMLARVE